MATRSTTIDVYTGNRQPVLEAIRRYRGCCRKLFAAVLVAETAGAEIVLKDESIRLQPKSDRARVALGAAIGAGRVERSSEPTDRGEGANYTVNLGKGLGYELRDWFRQELYPTSLSFVWDSARRDVTTVWTSGDPEFPKAKRGWLALQGSRGIAQFNWRGIGFPLATGRPKLEGHTITLKWDHEIGPMVFNLGKLDPGRSWIWHRLRDGCEGWKLGTLYLNERDGRLKVSLSYTCPDRPEELDPNRVCRVTVKNDSIVLVGPDGERTFDTIDLAEALERCTELAMRRSKWERRKGSLGSPRKSWGMHSAWAGVQEHLSRCTLQRELWQKDCNHAWTRRVISRCVSWRCGSIELQPFPEGIGPHPWAWSQFGTFLKYKADERGISLVAVENTPE